MEKSSLALAQVFELIRGDLEKVDQEFARHVQSQVDLIPKIGRDPADRAGDGTIMTDGPSGVKDRIPAMVDKGRGMAPHEDGKEQTSWSARS